MLPSSQATPTLPLTCTTSAGAGKWQLQVEFHNQGSSAFVVLRWHSPLDAWFSEFLQVSQQGKKLQYQGAKAKRGAPGEDDLLLLLPGDRHTELLDLTQAYQLAAQPAELQFSPIAVMPQPSDAPLSWQPERQQWLLCPPLQLTPPEHAPD